jgi:hypothetical protein
MDRAKAAVEESNPLKARDEIRPILQFLADKGFDVSDELEDIYASIVIAETFPQTKENAGRKT